MIHSFLLIGQSNMAGRGRLDEAIARNTKNIVTLRNGRWQGLFRPVNPDRPFSGTNLGESFASCYAEKYGVTVGLICCADGGTSLSQWQPGSLLFDNAVYQARLAQRTSTIAGVLWHQGEADCAPELYATYRQRFLPIMQALRKELDLYDVPFLLGGLGDYLKDCKLSDNLKNYAHVNSALKQIANEEEKTGFVSAAGLTSNPDYLHFNAASLHEFGIRYFNEYEKQKDPNKQFFEKPEQDFAVRTAMEQL